MANKISVLIDVTVDKANQALGNFKKAVGDADTTVGKFKAGAGAAFDTVKANAGGLAMAGGAALIGFGVKAVSAFQETALAAGELSDKLGLTAEDASKFIEVAGDMGIEVGDLESTIGRMNREIANSPGKFDAIGASIKRNKDGTVNVRESFLSVVDALNRMPDAADRAKAGQEIFGRSWQNIAEMVMMGANDLSATLDGIEANKIIDEGEVGKARDFRDSLDALNGVVEDLSLSFGELLVPIIADAAQTIVNLRNIIAKADEGTGGWMSRINGWVAEGVKWTTGISAIEWAADNLNETVEENTSSVNRNSGAMVQASIDAALLANKGRDLAGMYGEMEDGVRRANEATADMVETVNDLNDSMFDTEKSAIEFAQSIDDLRLKTMATNAIMADSESTDRDKAEAQRELRLAQIDVAEGALDIARAYAEESGAAEGTRENAQLQIDKLNEMKSQYPELRAEIDRYIATLLRVPGTVNTRITASVPRVLVNPDLRGGSVFGTVTVGATGGIVNRPTMALIGEAGPEAVVPLDKTPGNGPLPKGLGGGDAGIVINVQGLTGPQVADDIVNKIMEYKRRNGGLPW